MKILIEMLTSLNIYIGFPISNRILLVFYFVHYLKCLMFYYIREIIKNCKGYMVHTLYFNFGYFDATLKITI